MINEVRSYKSEIKRREGIKGGNYLGVLCGKSVLIKAPRVP